MKIVEKQTDELVPYARNPRRNDEAVDGVAASIREFGFKQPIVIDAKNTIVCGHTRWKAAQKLELESVPCVLADDLTKQQLKAYRILDNKLSEYSTWDFELLTLELDEIELDLGEFNVQFPEFGEIDPEKEWEGMPEFDQPDAKPYRSLIVHFETEDALNDFKRLIKQDFGEKAKYIYHPKKEREDIKSLGYIEDDES